MCIFIHASVSHLLTVFWGRSCLLRAALGQNHTDHVTRNDPTGGQRLSRVQQHLRPVQRQTEVHIRSTEREVKQNDLMEIR